MTENSVISTPVEPTAAATTTDTAIVMHYQVELQTPAEIMQLFGTALGAILFATALVALILNALNARRSR